MANIKTTAIQWERAREYIEAGLSLSKVSDKTGISKTQLSKRSNLEGWAKGTEKEQLLVTAVRVEEAKGNFSEQALSVHEELVAERVRDLAFFRKHTVKIVEKTMAIVDPRPDEDGKITPADIGTLDLAQKIVSRGQDSVCGKQAEVAVHVGNNNQQNNFGMTYEDVIAAIRATRED